MKLDLSLTTVLITCLTLVVAHVEDVARPVLRWTRRGNRASSSTSSVSVATALGYTSSSTCMKERDAHVMPPTSIEAGHWRNSSVFRSGSPSPGGVTPYDILPSTYMDNYPFNNFSYRHIAPDRGAYAYQYLNEFDFYNVTARRKETLAVICLCRQFADCMFDEDHAEDVVRALLGNGSYAALDLNKAQLLGNELVVDITLWDSVGAGSGELELLTRASEIISLVAAMGLMVWAYLS